MTLRILAAALFCTSALTAAEPAFPVSTPALAINALGLDLYRLESIAKPGNVLLSPYSIHAALAMTLGGADGITRSEMAKVLHLMGKEEDIPQQFTALRKSLEKVRDDSARRAAGATPGDKFEPVQLRVANRLFGQKGFPFDKNFLSFTQSVWQAPFEPLDFANAADAARLRVNDWVAQQTNRRIMDLIPLGGVTAGTSLVLVNALHFKAAWAEKFDASSTMPRPFVAAGRTVNVPTMHQQTTHGYLKEAQYTALTLPYTGSELQFLIILPHAKNGLAAVEKQLTAARLTKLCKLPDGETVNLSMPKFKLQPPGLPLAKHLKALGMKAAFDDPAGSAGFSRMAPPTGAKRLALSEVFHKTFLSLDEMGTEAAAATASDPFASAGIDVCVDHPFLFAIHHRESGVCLFLGRIDDPR